jgi:hypothetical protein
MCSQIVDASSTADLRFSPTTGTIPQTIETVLRASMAALILLMLTRVRFKGPTGGMVRGKKRAGRREPSTGGAAAPLTPGQARTASHRPRSLLGVGRLSVASSPTPLSTER